MKRDSATSNIYYNVDDEPMVIPQALITKILKLDRASDCIALLMFYYYTAKWQKNNQPKATNQYARQGLNWGMERVKKTKKILMDNKIIDVGQGRGKYGFTGTYIILNLYNTTGISSSIISKNINTNENTNNNSIPAGRSNGLAAGHTTNTLRNNKLKENIIKENLDIILFKLNEEYTSNKLFLTTLEKYIKVKLEINSKLTKKAWIGLANKISEIKVDSAIKALDEAIEKKWQTIWIEKYIDNEIKSPIELIKEKYPSSKVLRNDLISIYEKAADLLVDKSSQNKNILASNLFALIVWHKKQHTAKYGNTPGIFTLMEDYVGWIEHQDWLTVVVPKYFTPEHSVFLQFKKTQDDYYDNDILTGR